VSAQLAIPAIDLRGGRCVRLYQGDPGRETVYGDDPVGMARHWEQQGATLLHLVDLDGALTGSSANRAAIEAIGGAVDLVVADLSFISLPLVLPALAACTRVGGDLLPMVKPQFEVGRDRVGAGGVVRDPALRHEAVMGVVRSAAEVGLRTEGCVASPLPGPSGNVEYFLWLRRSPDAPVHLDPDEMHSLVGSAVRRGPQ